MNYLDQTRSVKLQSPYFSYPSLNPVPNAIEPVEVDQAIFTPSSFGKYPEQRPFEKLIWGNDDRTVINDTMGWPWRVHGFLEAKFPDGSFAFGSGTLINEHHVLTAGHCVFSEVTNEWAKSVKFVPARNGSIRAPVRKFWARELVSVTGWTENHREEEDYAMLVLNQSAGQTFGWMGLYSTQNDLDFEERPTAISGYPSEFSDMKQRYHEQGIISAGESFLRYNIDTSPGQSGASIWAQFEAVPETENMPRELIAGLHTDGDIANNRGVRINRKAFDNYIEWMRRW